MKKEKKIKIIKKETEYVSYGWSVGMSYDGETENYFETPTFTAPKFMQLIAEAKESLNNGLCKELGFSSIPGAILRITKITRLTLKNRRVFTNFRQYRDVFIGELSEIQKELVYHNL